MSHEHLFDVLDIEIVGTRVDRLAYTAAVGIFYKTERNRRPTLKYMATWNFYQTSLSADGIF